MCTTEEKGGESENHGLLDIGIVPLPQEYTHTVVEVIKHRHKLRRHLGHRITPYYGIAFAVFDEIEYGIPYLPRHNHDGGVEVLAHLFDHQYLAGTDVHYGGSLDSETHQVDVGGTLTATHVDRCVGSELDRLIDGRNLLYRQMTVNPELAPQNIRYRFAPGYVFIIFYHAANIVIFYITHKSRHISQSLKFLFEKVINTHLRY